MKFIIFIFIFLSLRTLGQDSIKKSFIDLDFIVNKIETTYAGLKDKSNRISIKKIKENINIETVTDTFETLSKVILPFNDHHLKLFEDMNFENINRNRCDSNLLFLSKKTKGKRNNKYEGYWINHLNTIIIYLKYNPSFGYSGYVIESKKNIPKGFCIIKMFNFKNGKYTTDYINIQNKVRTFLYSTFENNKTLSLNSYSKWRKVESYQYDYLSRVDEISKLPSISLIDSNTVLIKMPTFNSNRRKLYDSLIIANKNYIANSKNLIVDLRNNSGGVINCFLTLLPFICTKSIMKTEFYQFVSDDFIDDLKSKRRQVLDEKDTAMLSRYEEYIKSFLLMKDSFKLIPKDTLCTCKNDFENRIKNIGLIINNRCLSAAELMVLAFKQSSKVKIFGENSGGGVDFLDVKEYELPHSKYILWVARAKRKISNLEPRYDGKGISPDIEIKLEEKDWVDFVKKYYEKN